MINSGHFNEENSVLQCLRRDEMKACISISSLPAWDKDPCLLIFLQLKIQDLFSCFTWSPNSET